MKIIKDDKVYIQKKDLIFLYQSNLAIPRTLFFRANRERENINVNNASEYIEVDDLYEKEYFKKTDWIIDYQELEKLTNEDLFLIRKELELKKDNHIKNAIDSKNFNQEAFSILYQYDYQISSISEVIYIRQGLIDIKLPIELEINKERNIKILKNKK